LRARRQWPSDRRSTNAFNEIAPPHRSFPRL
jgi:hypothetical protein